jgi:energy-converting hydrogenase Eha subunit C
MKLDAHEAALWAIIAICLVLVGGVITANAEGLGVGERGALLGAIAGILLAVGWRIRGVRGGD